MIKQLLRADGFGRMAVMVMVCLLALAPVSCGLAGGGEGGYVGDDPCVAATTLAGQLMAALDQWDSGAALATMAPDQRTLARAAWLAAEGVQKQQNVAVHLTDLTYECVQSEDGSTSAAVTGTVVILDRESGAEKQRISDVNLEIAVAQQGETWYLLVDLPDIMGRLQPAQGGE